MIEHRPHEDRICDDVTDGAPGSCVLGALAEADAALHGTDGEKDALDKILKGVLSLGFERARVFIVSGDSEQLNVAAHAGTSLDYDDRPRQMPASLGELFGRPGARWVTADDVPADFRGLMDTEGVDACACAPIFHKGQLIGLIMADGEAGDESLLPLALFASQARTAVEHDLVVEVDARVRSLQSILQIYSLISSSLQLDKILKDVCSSIVNLIGVDECWLLLFTKELRKGIVRVSYPKGGMLHGLEIEIGDGPVMKTVVRDRCPLAVRDVGTAQGLGQLGEELAKGRARSSLLVPVVCKGKVIGIFGLDSVSRAHAFSQEEITLCRVFAAQLAVAIENAQLHDESEHRANQLEALRKTSLAVTSARRRDELLRTIMENAIKLLGGKSSGIYEYYPERQELAIIAEHKRQKNVGTVLKLGQGLAGRLARGDKPYLWVDDYNTWEGRAGIYWPERPFGAVLGVSLRWGGNIIGVLYIDDKVGRKFNDNDAQLLSLFGEQVAVALVNSKIAAQEEEKLRRLELVYKDAQEFMSTLGSKPLDERLAVIAKCATEVLGSGGCGIYIVCADGGLKLTAAYGQGADGSTPWFQATPSQAFAHDAASAGEPLNLCGEELRSRLTAVEAGGAMPPASLLALPLRRGGDGEASVLGLLCVIDKLDERGQTHPTLRFSVEDEWSLHILAEATCITIENARLIERLSEQQTRLSEQKRQMDDLVKNLPGGAVMMDLKGNVEQSNARAREILGYSEEEGLPSHVSELYFDPEEARRIGQRLDDVDGGLQEYQTFAKGRDGQPIPVRLHVTALRGPSGERVGSVGYFEDISPSYQTKILLEAIGVVARAERLEDGLQDLAAMLLRLLPSSFCRIMLLDKGGTHLTVEAAERTLPSGETAPWHEQRGQRIPRCEYHGLEPAVFRALQRPDAKALESLLVAADPGGQVQSLLMVPLKVGEKVFGLLDVGEFRKEEVSPFTKDRIALAAGIAEQVSVLIDRWRLQDLTNRRQHLLATLAERVTHIRGYVEPYKVLKEFVNHSAQLVGYKFACLYEYLPNMKALSDPILGGDGAVQPPEGWQKGAEDLALAVAAGRKSIVISEFSDYADRDLLLQNELRVVCAVPLKHPGGDVLAVLVVAGDYVNPAWAELELEALEKYAQVTSIAHQTASAMDDRNRTFSHLNLLHEIYEYIQEQQDVQKGIDAVMTGITAHYGLRFNRAVMLLVEDDVLVGVKGIGHLTTQESIEAWERDREHLVSDFKSYAALREEGREFPTPLGSLVEGLRYCISEGGADAFSEIVSTRRYRRLEEHELGALPDEFMSIFRPVSEVALVPMTAHGRVFGIIVADNIGTRAPIMPGELESLLTFGNTAAVAIDNIKLYRRLQDAREHLRTLFRASNDLVSPVNPRDILGNIADEIRRVVKAKWTRIILLDESDRARTLASSGCEDGPNLVGIVRPDGITVGVVRSGVPRAIMNTHEEGELNPVLVAPTPEALLCLRFPLKGKPPGAVWIGYPYPREFRDFEVDALQLYLNQAANAYDSASRLQVVENMHDAAEAMASTSSSERSALELIVKKARAVLRADSATLWPYDFSRNRFVPDDLVADNIQGNLLIEVFKTEPQPGGAAYVKEAGTVVVNDITDRGTNNFISESARELLKRLKVRSFLGLSLAVGDECFGILYVNYNEPRGFAPEELKTARIFTNHAALASKRAKLFEQLKKARNAAQVVAQVTALGTPGQSLHSVVHGTREALGCDAVTLYVFDPDRGDFEYPPVMAGVKRVSEVVELGRVTDQSVVRKVLKLRGLYVAKDTPNDPLLGRPFARREGIASSVAITLRTGEHPVGVMFVNYRDPHDFREDERASIDLFAQQAAVAIHNAQLYERARRRAGRLQVLHDAGSAITSSLDRNEILARIAEHAWKLASYRSSKEASFVDIKLIEAGRVQLAASHPPYEGERIKAVLGKRLEVGIGIVGRAIRTAMAQRVNDVTADPDYVCTHPETRSQVAVLIKRGEDVIGVINVEHPEENAFDEEAVHVLEALASQAGIAIENARQYEELDRTKTQVAAQTSLAWMGMASSTWGHAIQGHAINIIDEMVQLRRSIPEETRARYTRRLEKIERLAKRILERPITSALSSSDVKLLSLSDWIKERLGELRGYEPYSSIDLRFDPASDTPLPTRINPEWLRQVFDILVDNAVNAMTASPVRRLTVTAAADNDCAEVYFRDTGLGIAPDVLPRLFGEPIPKGEGDKGLGMGLLMAQTIIQAFGGKIKVGETGPSGTTMIVRIPLAR